MSNSIADAPRQWWNGIDEPKQTRMLLAIVLLVAIAPYLNSLANGFAFDDVFIISGNPRVHRWPEWTGIWLKPYWPSLGAELGLYRPLSIFLWGAQWAAGGGGATLYHAVSVSLHALVCALIFLLLRKLYDRDGAFLGALVFAVHPLHTEAVANLVGQAELAVAALVLTACLIHVTRPDGAAVSWPRRLMLAALYALALLAKESAVVLPGLLVVLDCVQGRLRPSRQELRGYISAMAFPVVLLCVTLLAYLLLRYYVLEGTLTGVDAGPAFPYLKQHRLLNAFRAVPEYFRLLFWPADLTVDYAPATVFPVESVTLMVAVGALLLVSLTVVAATTPWLPAAGAAAAWFLISLSPVSNIFFPIGVLVAERTLYLPSVAVSLLIAVAAVHVRRRTPPERRGLLAPAFVCALLALAARTWIRNPDWKSTTAVQTALFRDHPEAYHAQWGMAIEMWDRSRMDDGLAWFRLANRTYNKDSGLLANYATFLAGLGRDDEALPLVRESFDMHPFMANSTALLAYLYVTTRQFPKALEITAHGESLGFPTAIAMPLRAYTYQGMGELDRAVEAWGTTARRIKNGKWLAYGFLARTMAFDERIVDARNAIATGITVAPDSASAALLRRVDRAIADGCYDPALASANGDLYGPAVTPSCDPLIGWFDHATRVQGARLSQFAIPLRVVNAPRPAIK